MNVHEERPNKYQLLIHKNKLYYVSGYRFDVNFIDMKEVGGNHETTLPFYLSKILDLTLDDIPDVKNLSDFRIKYPEYFI